MNSFWSILSNHRLARVKDSQPWFSPYQLQINHYMKHRPVQVSTTISQCANNPSQSMAVLLVYHPQSFPLKKFMIDFPRTTRVSLGLGEKLGPEANLSRHQGQAAAVVPCLFLSRASRSAIPSWAWLVTRSCADNPTAGSRESLVETCNEGVRGGGWGTTMGQLKPRVRLEMLILPKTRARQTQLGDKSSLISSTHDQ